MCFGSYIDIFDHLVSKFFIEFFFVNFIITDDSYLGNYFIFNLERKLYEIES